jgi:protein tyrosine/serine phosphatase
LANKWSQRILSTLFLITGLFTTPTVLARPEKQVRKLILISELEKFFDNFHTVQKHELYRSAQLSAHSLKKYIKKYNIKTIINLRGPHHHSKWWEKERAIAQEYNIKLYNICMTARTFPTKESVKRLLYLYNHAPKPILIHCYSGADRTGEAAALWVLEQQKQSKKRALKQLSLKYRYIYANHPAKEKFIKSWDGINSYCEPHQRNTKT